MRLEYFEDPQSPDQRVLLTYGDDSNEAALLQDAIAPLVNGQTGHHVQIERLPGFHGVDGCSLTAQVGSSNLGVVPIEGADRAFRCVLDPAGWRHVSGRLEPFAAGHPTAGQHAHQYLTDAGPIEWIISTDRGW